MNLTPLAGARFNDHIADKTKAYTVRDRETKRNHKRGNHTGNGVGHIIPIEMRKTAHH